MKKNKKKDLGKTKKLTNRDGITVKVRFDSILRFK